MTGQRAGKSPGERRLFSSIRSGGIAVLIGVFWLQSVVLIIFVILIAGFGACIVCETTTGVILSADVTSTPGPGNRTVPEDLAEKAAYLLLEEICRGGCIDSSFQSIACVYMVLQAKDLSQCLFGPLSPYT